MSDPTQAFDREAIHHHYDLSNEFYQLFLDPWMLYTCAYYRDPEDTLEQAQLDKLELVCRKLRLHAGERLLDIGCGWGSLAIWAAKHHGVRVLGVTLAEEQARFAHDWIRRAGLADHCRVECRDYRDLAALDPFDKVAAIGLIEHIGPGLAGGFFEGVHELLRPEGLFLNHGISRNHTWQRTPQWDFLIENVFPNAKLRHLSRLTEQMEQQRFEILDVENLRPHYARTCRHWAERLRLQETRAIALVGERTYRTWLLYLTASSISFEQSSLNLHQVLVQRVEPARVLVPTTREGTYASWPRRAARAQAAGA